MRNLPRLFCALLCALLLFTGCQDKSDPPTTAPVSTTPASATPPPTDAPITTVPATDAPTQGPVLDVNPAIEGISSTTGLAFDGVYKPIIIQYPNTSKSRPQWNISLADIVYETVVTGDAYTRLSAIFNDTTPAHTGPIRSARMMHIDIAREWDAPLVFFGGQVKAGTNIFDRAREVGLKQYFDGNSGGSNFSRDDSRARPDNAYTDVATLQSQYTYDPTPRPFLYDDAAAFTQSVTEISITYRPDNAVRYVWDAQANAYLRYLGNTPFMDGETKTQVAVTNIIVQTAAHSLYENHNERVVVELVGSGKAEYFIGGTYEEGTWERSSIESRTIYYDAAGNEILLRPGNTWIQMNNGNIPLEFS